MNKKVNIMLLLIFSLIFAGFLWKIAIPYIGDMSKRCRTIGMVCAVDGAFAGELKRGNSSIHRVLGEINKGLTLNPKKYDTVINELLLKGNNLDHPKLETNEPFFDPWGNRLVIWCRKLPDGRYMSQVTSKGRDGILGNADDIRSGEKLED